MDSNLPPQQPPFNTPPPVITPTHQARAQKGGRGWKVFAIVLIVILAISLFLNMQLFVGSALPGAGKPARSIAPKFDEVIFEHNNSANKIAVIDVEGLITSHGLDQNGLSYVDIIREQFNLARDDSRVKAVILKVNSPGGEVMASDEIHQIIVDFQDESEKPVIASMGSLAASGGYYVSAPCQWIVANELTITGSIGVILQSWNYRELMNKVGLRPEVYKSGKFKDMLSGARPPEQISPEERAMVQALIDQTYVKFKEVVAAGRSQANEKNQGSGRTLTSDWEKYADGRILSGSDAFKLGFVDELGNFETAVARAEKLASIDSANIIKYQQRFNFSDFFQLFGETETRTIKVDLGMDLPKLQAGYLYFLSPTLMH